MDLFFRTSDNQSLSQAVLTGRSQTIKSSSLCEWILAGVEWNETLYPAIDFNAGPQNAIQRISSTESTLLLTNLSKSTVLIDESACGSIGNAYIANCADSTIYVSVPLSHVSIVGCVDCEIILMAVTGAVTVSLSEKVILRSVSAHMRLENVIDTQLFIHTTRTPLLTGDTRGIIMAPFNVVWHAHEQLLVQHTTLHRDSSHSTLWSQPICACLSESPYILLQPAKFRIVSFPDFSGNAPKAIAVCMPQVYCDALVERQNMIAGLKREIQNVGDDAHITKVNAVISGHFREWLTSSNKTRVMSDLIKQKLQ